MSAAGALRNIVDSGVVDRVANFIKHSCYFISKEFYFILFIIIYLFSWHCCLIQLSLFILNKLN